MIDKSNIEKTNAWPFVEAKKILKERKKYIESKGKITLQTGYGPSGLPHIGTFGEVARTSMIVNALNQITDLPKEIITFSDDMDGLRKVPDNVPNQDILKGNFNVDKELNYVLVANSAMVISKISKLITKPLSRAPDVKIKGNLYNFFYGDN